MGEPSNRTFGLVIAGGRSQRMGQDKASIILGGVTLLERAAGRLAAHCTETAVSLRGASNADPIVERLGLRRLIDPPGLAEGPLSGVLAGLRWAQEEGAARLVTLPCDTPFPPENLIERLLAAAGPTGCAVVRTPDGLQSLCAVWSVGQLAALEGVLAGGAHPPVRAPLLAAGCALVDYADAAAFLNINTPEDLAAAHALLR